MQKNELRKWQGSIIRVLAKKDDQLLTIDCIHRKIPFWVNVADLGASTECSEEELHTATKTIPALACLSPAAYNLMLKEKYCDGQGTLLPLFPSIYQFRYFFKKYNKLRTQYISRDGIKDYQRNHRPLLGEGVREFAPSVGVGMLDSTICDIFLVNDAGQIIGRPILTACVDAYSGLCCGYTLSWEGGVYSLRQLMNNIIADKTEWCQRFCINIEQSDWPCQQLPGTLVTDMGREYASTTFEQIAELGITVVNLPAYRPELKEPVERFFGLVQGYYKHHLKGKGIIEADYQERGAHDYRKDACLTMQEFETILLHCIVFYNCKRIIQQFPYTKAMLAAQVAPYSSQLWHWGKGQPGANLISVTQKQLSLTLLPRTQRAFCRDGLHVYKLRYRHDGYTEQYLTGGSITVAYDPDNTSTVWTLEKGSFVPFQLIESQHAGLSFDAVNTAFSMQRQQQKTHKQPLYRLRSTLGHILMPLPAIAVPAHDLISRGFAALA